MATFDPRQKCAERNQMLGVDLAIPDAQNRVEHQQPYQLNGDA